MIVDPFLPRLTFGFCVRVGALSGKRSSNFTYSVTGHTADLRKGAKQFSDGVIKLWRGVLYIDTFASLVLA